MKLNISGPNSGPIQFFNERNIMYIILTELKSRQASKPFIRTSNKKVFQIANKSMCDNCQPPPPLDCHLLFEWPLITVEC